jgi:hypothetical protein
VSAPLMKLADVEAMGGELELTFKHGDRRFPMTV